MDWPEAAVSGGTAVVLTNKKTVKTQKKPKSNKKIVKINKL